MDRDEIRPSGARLYQAAWLIYLLLAIAGAVWMGFSDGGLTLGRFVDRGAWARDVGWGLASGGLLLALWEAGRRWLPRARELERTIADLLSGISPADALGLAVISGFAEEVFFRGAVQGSWGIVVATALFALLHTGPGREFRLWTIFAAVAGLAFGLLVRELGSLLAPVIAHILVNAVNLSRLARAGSRPESTPG